MASTIDSFQIWFFFDFLIFLLFFVCIFSSFFFIFPFFISYCTVQCVTFLIFLVGAWLCTSKGKIQWCIKLLSAHHQGPTSSVNKACYKSYEMLILLSNSFCQSLFRKSVATNFTLQWFLSFMNRFNMSIHVALQKITEVTNVTCEWFTFFMNQCNMTFMLLFWENLYL